MICDSFSTVLGSGKRKCIYPYAISVFPYEFLCPLCSGHNLL
ncbi:hypothetical protein N430_03060 [Pseudomonas sp. CC120222-01a]|nr:hypothetical protein N430_03060 [Pseudomonas sp. CC120222-01a]